MIDGAVAEGDTLVTIIVGGPDNKKTYRLSKNKLVGISAYFKAAFGNEERWIEGATQTSILDEEEPISFDLLIQWIYWRAVVLPRASETSSAAEKSPHI